MSAPSVTLPEGPPRPAAGTPRPWAFPAVDTRRLDGDLTLLVAPVHTLPLVSVLVVTAAGADGDAAGHEGLAAIAARAMVEGTATRDGAALALAAEQLGTAVDAAADWDGAYASFTALAPKAEAALALLAEVVTTPAFPTREVERLKAERLADIAQTEKEPRGLADEHFAAAVYAAGSRFARPLGGTRTSVGALDAAACRAHHAARWRRGGSTVIVVGNITADGAEALVSRGLSGWRGAAGPRTSVVDARTAAGRRVLVVDRPGATQSELRVGHVAVPRTHPDYFPLVLGNAILGGLFNSRLNMNLRERNGFTYGAGSGFDWRRQAGPFVASAAVETAVTEPALREMLGELDAIRSAPVAAAELDLAQQYLDGVFPLRYETTGAIADALAARVTFGLPEDWFARYRERVRGVTAEQVQAAMQTHLDPSAWQIVVVGDAATVAPVLESMALGPVAVVPGDLP
ncbi:MAG: insulinase family protein [Gemmatimonadaceae bacterium]|jgi:zinc protease|nr:insulinase family protein [Gemmatimonadaceae bacterium]